MLLTPGPLTVSRATKEAMLRDWGSRDEAFIRLNLEVRARLLAVAEADDDYAAVPLQGAGTFGVEATLGTLISPRDKALVLVNGAYGRRIAAILARLGRAKAELEWPEDAPVDPEAVARHLFGDPAVTHVAVVHCETTSGLLNPLAEVAHVVRRAGRRLVVDAMSSFGAIPVRTAALGLDAVVASANKCLEGVPGVTFAIVRTASLLAAKGNAPSLSLDLHDQYTAMEKNGQWRFTPPTHVIAALHHALAEHAAEGGVAGRGSRYAENCRVLVQGMGELGFEALLPARWQAPIIVTFRMPSHPRFHFATFYDGLRRRGFVIYPGKLTAAESFRMGCIGHLGPEDMRDAVTAVRETLAEMGVPDGRP